MPQKTILELEVTEDAYLDLTFPYLAMHLLEEDEEGNYIEGSEWPLGSFQLTAYEQAVGAIKVALTEYGDRITLVRFRSIFTHATALEWSLKAFKPFNDTLIHNLVQNLVVASVPDVVDA